MIVETRSVEHAMIREIYVDVEQDRNRHKLLSRGSLQEVPKGVTELRASNETALKGSDTRRMTTCPEASAHMDQEIVLHTLSMNGSNEAGLERDQYAVLSVTSRSHVNLEVGNSPNGTPKGVDTTYTYLH